MKVRAELTGEALPTATDVSLEGADDITSS